MFDKSTVPTDDPMYEHIDRINQSIAVVRGFLKDKVSFDSLEDIPMLTGQAEIFFQGHLRRALAFLDGAKHAQDAGHELIEITAVRCLYESAACIHDFSNQLIRLIDAGQMTDAVLLAHQRSFAHRFEVKAMNTDQFDYTAVNVMWPAPGSEDTELGVLMELEVGHGEASVYARVQA